MRASTRLAQAEEAIQQYRDILATRSVASLFWQQKQNKSVNKSYVMQLVIITCGD